MIEQCATTVQLQIVGSEPDLGREQPQVEWETITLDADCHRQLRIRNIQYVWQGP